MTIPQALNTLMQNHGMTKRELAEVLGISISAMNAILKDEKEL